MVTLPFYYGGLQDHYGVTPDLTTMGKGIGGGLPIGAWGGKREIMEYIAPLGPVYQAGTLSGNPIAMAAGLKTLELVSTVGFYEVLDNKVTYLVNGILEVAKDAGIAMTANHVGGMFGLFFSDQQVSSFKQATECNADQFRAFFHGMLEHGIYLAPSQFESGFVSTAHGEEQIRKTIQAMQTVFGQLA